MTLVKTSLLNGIAVGIRIFTMLALNKILAIHVGPSGYAAIGQFQNFVSMVTTIASGAANTGVTKYTAEYFDNEARQIAIWKAAGTIALTGSVGLGLALTALHRPLAAWILKDEAFAGVFVWFGACLVLFTFNGLLLAVINGKKEVNRFVIISIASSLVGLVVTGGLATWWGLYGALVALAINQSIVFGLTLVLCWRQPWFDVRKFIGRIEPDALRALGKFILMALTSAACVPISHMLIRSHLGTSFGIEAAGHWEALMRISSLYLMIVTTPLAVYYLPRLSEIRDHTELKREILHGYRIILPVAVGGAFAIYLLRDWVVATLFSAEFAPMRDLFAWQLMGDTLKVGSWLLAYVMLGKAMVKTFVITEISFSVIWVALVWLLTGMVGEKGAQLGYLANYAIYWLVLGVVVMRKFGKPAVPDTELKESPR